MTVARSSSGSPYECDLFLFGKGVAERIYAEYPTQMIVIDEKGEGSFYIWQRKE